MAENNIEEIPSSTNNENIENLEDHQEPPKNNVENTTASNDQEDTPKTTGDEEDHIDKSKRSAKMLLIIVNVFTLLCSLILFVMGVIMTVNHARVHEEWHAGYGVWNASIVCIVIALVLAGLGTIGKSLFITRIYLKHRMINLKNFF